MDVFDMGEFFHVGISPLKRTVDRIVGEVEKKRFVVMTINEVDRFAGEGIGEIFGFFDRLTTADDGVVRVVVRFITVPP